MSPEIRWYTPAPLWPKRLQNGSRSRLQRPELLQFEQDDFMAELQTTLRDAPNALEKMQAEGETHLGENGSAEGPIPLYQPAHERYYLVTASLVCRKRGLPDRAVETANEERVSFLVRRLVSEEGGGEDGTREYGWDGETWQPVGETRPVVEGEERLSMFPQTYDPTTPQERMKGRRRLWAGLIPVAKRETYEAAPLGPTTEEGGEARVPSDDPDVDSRYALDDPRTTHFQLRVLQAVKGVRDRLASSSSSVVASDVRDPLLFAWLDLWQFLDTHLPEVARAITSEGAASGADFDAKEREKQAVLRRLVDTAGAREVLQQVANRASSLEAGELDVLSLPSFSDGGRELDRDALLPTLNALLAGNAPGESLAEQRPKLQGEVSRALGDLDPSARLPEELQPPSTAPTDGAVYVVRCLYERPTCPPPIRWTVSAPSRPFRLASFFDAEAPPRDINITLPGASVQDFRDSSQSVTMRFTKELRKQAQRIGDITLDKLQEEEVGPAPSVNVGMICSLSIPIITICALILLLIMVVLLNIVFWWLPFFKICFPLPSGD